MFLARCDYFGNPPEFRKSSWLVLIIPTSRSSSRLRVTNPKPLHSRNVCYTSVTTITDEGFGFMSESDILVVVTQMPHAEVSLELQEKLRSIATSVPGKKGTILFRTGQPGRGAFLIRSGRIRLTLDGNSSYPARILRAGALVGLPASFSAEPYSLTAEAVDDCELNFIPRDQMLNLLRRDPEAGLQIVQMLSEEVSRIRKSAKAIVASP
jgi:cyclic nucleotide-binding protein